jgi:glycosyltransferase involved in cell wall biosynthesis
MSDTTGKGKRPLLSIVTISFRNPVELLSTLRSTEMLDPAAVERIVVDGSPDQSCSDIISDFNVPIASYIHEPDKGIYDAMNKGVRIARGHAVLMLNSGDLIFDSRKLSDILWSLRSKLDDHVVYGQTVDRFPEGDVPRNIVSSISRDDIRRGDLPSHQSTIVPTAFAKANPYDTSFKSAADTDFLRRAYSSLPALAVSSPISIFSYGGRSNAGQSLGNAISLYAEHVKARNLTVAEKAKIFARLSARSILGYILGTRGHRSLQARRAQMRSGIGE